MQLLLHNTLVHSAIIYELTLILGAIEQYTELQSVKEWSSCWTDKYNEAIFSFASKASLFWIWSVWVPIWLFNIVKLREAIFPMKIGVGSVYADKSWLYPGYVALGVKHV